MLGNSQHLILPVGWSYRKIDLKSHKRVSWRRREPVKLLRLKQPTRDVFRMEPDSQRGWVCRGNAFLHLCGLLVEHGAWDARGPAPAVLGGELTGSQGSPAFSSRQPPWDKEGSAKPNFVPQSFLAHIVWCFSNPGRLSCSLHITKKQTEIQKSFISDPRENSSSGSQAQDLN